jgi:hypothetical protein
MARATLLFPVACVLAAPLLVTLALQFGHDPRRAETERTLHARDKDYVGASTCRDCHPDRFATWRRTYHSTMTQLPSRTAVLGQFDGNTVTLFGSSATPLERDGRFYFQLPAYAGEGPREAEVALLVGSRRYQQYFERTEDADGITYRRLPLLWHVGERRWMHLNGVFLEPDNDDWAMHRTVWNANCIFCHNTGVVPGLTPQADGSKRLDSHVADLGIACESCHGPGREHAQSKVALSRRYGAQLGLAAPADDIVDPLRLDQAESTALCGQCHSQRLPDPVEKLWTYLDTGPTFRPGGLLAGHVKPIDRDTPSADPHQPNAFRDRFWGDGTARLTAYEYLGLTQSPCFQDRRFTCGSCHTSQRCGAIAPAPSATAPSRKISPPTRTTGPSPADRAASIATCRARCTGSSPSTAATGWSHPTFAATSRPGAPTPAPPATSPKAPAGQRRGCGNGGGRATSSRGLAPTARRWKLPKPSPPCTLAIRCSGRFTLRRWAGPTLERPPPGVALCWGTRW